MKFIQNIFFFIVLGLGVLQAQSPEITCKVHSHNDYEQPVPFWKAYAAGVHSIEIDVINKNDTLFVAHEAATIVNKHTIETLYLRPLRTALKNGITVNHPLQFLIDIKTEAYSTLDHLVKILGNYPDLTENKKIRFVISGGKPKAGDYTKYPDFIWFDHQELTGLSDRNSWNKVALVSVDYKDYSVWNGKGRMTAGDLERVKNVIQTAHSLNKPFRFWGAPDSKSAWKAFTGLGVDFINTDKPFEATRYLNSLSKRIGFNPKVSEIYKPQFVHDKKNHKVKNIILLIGDGNGLSQISAAALANGGNLTLTQLKSIGFLKTQSADDFTTDSAAGGTAIATGVKTYNRAIGVAPDGKPVKNISEILIEQGFKVGLITTDEITGATPSAFYAHQKDRSHTQKIASDLVKSDISLFIGGGAKYFSGVKEMPFSLKNSMANITAEDDRVGVLVAEGGLPGVKEGRGNFLAEATQRGLSFLKSKKNPFLLMVEGSHIDSYGHFNDTDGIIAEGIDFDKAVAQAIKFADADKNTLVIVTADHETSGFSIPQGDVHTGAIEGDFTTHDHTGAMVPLFAYGPQSDKLQGVYENSELLGKILEILKMKTNE
ncbi:alkaline phosphatase [Zhouia spongiae]|uniref:Alkaline phosphatase n=1 Tax=Zhouia spongiae TaxID=2202721 RepID=A0ABY3YJU1_9FLAO|nr:alkaline phosphatase [Zhouia spongiae]UNY97916.1 alkaline phosphatase [Zhouia spongiae]